MYIFFYKYKLVKHKEENQKIKTIKTFTRQRFLSQAVAEFKNKENIRNEWNALFLQTILAFQSSCQGKFKGIVWL